MDKLEYINCPFCDSKNYKELFSGKDFLFSKEEFSVVRCQDCGLRYTNPRVKEDRISFYYYPGYSLYKNPKLPAFYHGKRSGFRRFFGNIHLEILDLMRSINARTVLEIGPGNGRLLCFLKEQGFDVAGVELDSSSARSILDQGIRCYCGDLNVVMDEISGKRFDAVILCQAFEHLYDPKKTLKNIHNLLAEKGFLYMSLPNSDSIEAKLFGKFWRGFDLPRHIVHCDKNTIKSVLTKCGFNVIAQKNQNFPSSFVESVGFRFFKNGKIPSGLYYPLYCLWKLMSPIHFRLFGSGVMTVASVKRAVNE